MLARGIVTDADAASRGYDIISNLMLKKNIFLILTPLLNGIFLGLKVAIVKPLYRKM